MGFLVGNRPGLCMRSKTAVVVAVGWGMVAGGMAAGGWEMAAEGWEMAAQAEGRDGHQVHQAEGWGADWGGGLGGG